MNEIVKAPARRKWTLAELDRLSAHGFFGEHEHVELIEGELITMPAKGVRHERVRGIISNWVSRRLTAGTDCYQELGWRPGRDLYLEPDLLLCHEGGLPPCIPPASVLLVVEFAKSSLAYDHGLKAGAYAALGIEDYWVINATDLMTRVHRRPTPDRGYVDKVDVPAAERLVPLHVPGLALRLADLDFGDEGRDEVET